MSKTQKRGDERRKRILDAALALVGAGGVEAVTMSATSKESGVPTGSLYQYFPERNAILIALAEREFLRLRDLARAGRGDIETLADLRCAAETTMKLMAKVMRAEPGLRFLWSGMDANPDFSHQFSAVTQAFSAVFAERLKPFSPDMAAEDRMRLAALIVTTLKSTSIAAAAMPEREADAFVADATEMIWRRIVDQLAT